MSGKPALLLLMVALALAGCGSTQQAAPEQPAAAPEAAVPADVVAAREAVVDFLREGAISCVPPEVATWRTTTRDIDLLEGFRVYQFSSGDCMTTVTVPRGDDSPEVYHVAVANSTTGFCWQAVVDGTGELILTGALAQADATFGNPAQTYCEQQGYTFELRGEAAGGSCGYCVFDEGRECNAWAYFHGACSPQDHAPAQ